MTRNICVVGLGYIGLPTAVLIASKGMRVYGVDIEEKVVKHVNQGFLRFNEPGLEEKLKSVVEQGLLTAATKAPECDVYLIAVPTPMIKQPGQNIPHPDLSFLQSAMLQIIPQLKQGDTVIIESTSPVGTTENIAELIKKERPNLVDVNNEPHSLLINLAYCPERVIPGNTLFELEHNERIIGGLTKNCAIEAKNFYTLFVNSNCSITDCKTAEMAKLTENACRDVQIAFANELSIICDKLGIDVWRLIELANRHPRVEILNPGPGVGGHCIAIDPWFLVEADVENSRLIKKARQINDEKPKWVVKKIMCSVEQCFAEKKFEKDIEISIYGLTYKSNIDDFRESPALKVVELLSKNFKGKVNLIDPYLTATSNIIKNLKNYTINGEGKEADIHVLLVAHKEFKNLKKTFSKSAKVIDTVNF